MKNYGRAILLEVTTYKGGRLMKEQTLRVSVKDITALRLNCTNCGGSIEVSLEDIRQQRTVQLKGQCKLCGYTYYQSSAPMAPKVEPVIAFAEAIEKIVSIDSKMEIEIVVPLSSDDTA